MTDVSTQQLVAANDRATEMLLSAKLLKPVPNTDSLFVLDSLYNESLILKQVKTLNEAIQCGGLMCLATEFLYSKDITSLTDQEALELKDAIRTADPQSLPTLAVAGATMIDYLRQPECRSIYIPTLHAEGRVQNIGNGMARASLDLSIEYVTCDVSTTGRPWVYYAMVGNIDVGWGVSGGFLRPCTNVRRSGEFASAVAQATDKRRLFLENRGVYRESPDMPRVTARGASLFVGVKPIPYPKMLHELVTSVVQNQVKDEDSVIKVKMTDALSDWRVRTPNTVVGLNTLLVCAGGFTDGTLNLGPREEWPKTDYRLKPGVAHTNLDGSFSFSAVSRSLVGEIDIKLKASDSIYFGCTQSSNAPSSDGSYHFMLDNYYQLASLGVITIPSNTPDDDTVTVTAEPTEFRVKMIQMGAPAPVKDRMCNIPVLHTPWFIMKGANRNTGVIEGAIPVSMNTTRERLVGSMATRFHEHPCLSLLSLIHI